MCQYPQVPGGHRHPPQEPADRGEGRTARGQVHREPRPRQDVPGTFFPDILFVRLFQSFNSQVVVKTVSGSVASWPATGNVTTRPLPVQNLRQRTEADTGEVKFEWEPHPESNQDSYRVSEFSY